MILIDINTKQKYELNIPAHRTGEYYSICPACSQERKRGNENKKCLMFNVSKGTGKCFNCDAVFVEFKENYKPMNRPERIEKEYKRPEWRNNTNLSEKLVKWFEGRKISQFILRQMKISEGLEWMPQTNKEENTVQFNYFRDDILINTKFRDGAKNFKLVSGAELILYNLDAIKESNECLICEGEMDCLSWIEAGYQFAVSVPNGAGKKTQNMQYLDNCIDYFENKEKIYISYDNDEPGNNLKDELIRRLGSERCFLVDLQGEKDANDYLIKYGELSLKETLTNAKEIPVEGVFDVEAFEQDLDYMYLHGIKPGLKLGLGELDSLFMIESKRLLIVTGIPGHGKSEFVDEVVERLNIYHGWKSAYFSPENFPLQYHGKKIIEKLTGKHFKEQFLSHEEYIHAKVHMYQNFFFIMPKDDQFTLDNILEKTKVLIKRKGIKVLVIDPWNRLESHQEKWETETKYINRQLTKLTNFAKTNDILIILVAHPTKIAKNAAGRYEIPNLYNISGSANFFNQTDYGITVYRNYDEEKIEIHVQKVKFKHLGKIGTMYCKYDINNGRLNPIDDNGNYEYDTESHLIPFKQKLKEINVNEFLEPNKKFYDIPF